MNEEKIVRFVIMPVVVGGLSFAYFTNPDGLINFIIANQIPIGIIGGVGFVGLSLLARKQATTVDEKVRINQGFKVALISLAVSLVAIGIMFAALQGQLHSLMEAAGSAGK